MPRPYFEITYDWIHANLRQYEAKLQPESFGAVVGIVRGGTVPAFILSQMLDCPLHFLQFSRITREAKWHTEPVAEGKKILLVDDIAGQGGTLFQCREFLTGLGYPTKTLTVGYDSRSQLVPDFGVDFGEKIIIFPWEPHRLNSRFIGDLAENRFLPDGQYRRVGWDLDGLLLPDLPEKDYTDDIVGTLNSRDRLLPHEATRLPPRNSDELTIVTARPHSDFDRTQQWLDQNGFAPFRLHCRDEEKFSYSEAAKFKAEKCRELGLTDFYESDLLQATLISHYAPLLKVYCWNSDRGLRILLGPSKLID